MDTVPSDTDGSRTTPGQGILPGEHLHALRARLHGALILPEDAAWEEACRPWALLSVQRPAAVVVAADAADVVETVRAAAKLGLRVAPQGTGHGAGALPGLDGAILLRTSRLAEVEIDPAARTVRVGAGAVWGDVVAAAARHGLAAVTGMSAGVGVAGFVLGGGVGWLSRSHGLGSRSLRAIEGVNAKGAPVRADADSDPELLWAARGGSLPIVVTALELQLHEIGALTAGGLLWPLERAADVVHAWREWIGTVPDGVTSLVRVLRYPPIPDIPEAVRGRAFVAVEAAVQDAPEGAAALLAPLRALGPELDTIRPMAPDELASVHGDPIQPAPAHGDAVMLAELSEAAVEAFLAAVLAPAAGALLSVEIRHLGGAVALRADDAALPGLDGAGLVYAVGIVPAPEAFEPVRAAASAVVTALAPFASARAVKTFAERPVDATTLYGPAAERLRALAAARDPERLILLGHPLD